ncbi:hypothetical protein Q1695_006493 [Nippostrongylus brasiliensis]|nr:hypothetical protein Q1695_006493 [Nippostrongylus brasiliensis]
MSTCDPCCSKYDQNKEIDAKENTGESSSSADETEEDLADLCRRFDSQLEEKAKMHNLNALNVKSILYRVMKDPHVLDSLMGIKSDTDGIPSVKVTRSKVKHSTEPAKVELKPVPPPRTFLDVQFENEDDDEDYRPEELQSDDSEDDEEGNETLTTNDHEKTCDKDDALDETIVNADRDENVVDSNLMVNNYRDSVVSPYPLRSRLPHVLTFVENPDYLNFLQGIKASTPIQENSNVAADDDDPDDEEYNVLTELERLRELERDKDELRMDRFTEIPTREVEGLFKDLLGDTVETIMPELISTQTPSPKKKRTKRRSKDSADGRGSKCNKTSLPVDEPPPDGSYSCSLISGEPVTFKAEELEQLRIQMEQHVQLLTQSVVMCFHDDRLTHVKNTYQLMINELDRHYYEAGPSSLFNISNLAGAIESCHDIMGVSRVPEVHVKWDATPFGWSPRPEAALVLGRSRAVIYPDLLPGVQPDLFEFPHQFFTAGEDLLLAHALVQFRHIPHSSSRDPFGRLYWVQKMLLPCKTVLQIGSHLRVARQHVEGQVNNRNPMYQIIMQALRGVCHLRFPFERPAARYETLQMWPEEERPIWYNKFSKHFMTCGPTMVMPQAAIISSGSECKATTMALAVDIPPQTPTRQPQRRLGVSCSSVSYEVDVSFFNIGASLHTAVTVRPYSYHFESVSALFGNSTELAAPERSETITECDSPNPSLAMTTKIDSADSTPSRIPDAAGAYSVSSATSPSLPDILTTAAADPEFSVYEPGSEFQLLSTPVPQELQVPKSEFSLDLEEGEIVSGENSLDGPTSGKDAAKTNGSRRSSRCERYTSDRRKRSAGYKKSASPPAKRQRKGVPTKKVCDRLAPRTLDLAKKRQKDVEYRDSSRRSQGRARARRRSSSSERKQSRSRSRKLYQNNDSIRGEVTRRSQRDRENVASSRRTSTTSAKNLDNNVELRGGSRRSREKIHDVSRERSSENREVSCCVNKEFRNLSLSQSASAVVCIAIKPSTSASITVQCILEPEEPRTETCTELMSCSWKDSDFLYDDCDDRDFPNDASITIFDSPYIPRTPSFDTPSDYSPLGTVCPMSGSRSRTPESDWGVPVTPRDDARTRSPTLLRAPSSVGRALFAKIELKQVPTSSCGNSGVCGAGTKASCWKENWECIQEEHSVHDDVGMEMGPSSSYDTVANDDSEDAPGSEMYSTEAADDGDAGSKTRMKRRTRTEKERMGLERMQNPHHRLRQMANLARKIAVDIKQRTFMHQDVMRSVERIVLGQESLETQFDRLKAVLLPDHADVLALLSLLAEESVLPPELLTSPLRRAYHGAVQILLAIEAYCQGTRSRSSNTRSLLKTIGSMGQTLNESEFCDRLADLLSNERPLWNYIRQWLPLPYDEKVAAADFEFIDLCKRSDCELVEDGGAECIDDLNAVLGNFPPRRGGPLQVTAGQLNSLQSGVYVPISISKEKSPKEQSINQPKELNWTKETDMLLLKTYNDVEGGIEEVVKELALQIPYSPADIEERLKFLISLF